MIRRRHLLAGSVGVLAISTAGTGCEADEPGNKATEGDEDRPPPEPDPDLPLYERLVAAEQDMLTAYDTTVREHHGLKKALAHYRKHHRAHLDALREAQQRALANSPGTPSPDPITDPSSSPSAPDPDVPADADAAVKALLHKERKAATEHRDQLGAAHSGELARLIAAIAASETLHLDALESVS